MNIFIAFANQDRDVRDKLLRQMNLVKDRQGWNIWSAKEIKAGERWGDEIERRLRESDVVVLLLSTDFFNSEYIIEKELPEVVEKHKQGNCHIIPVIARMCHWKDTPFGEYAELGDIQALPAGEKPIVSRGHWDNEDQPYFEVVQGIRDSIKAFQAKKQAAQALVTAALAAEKETAQQAERERMAAEKRLQEAEAARLAQAERARLQALKKQNAARIPWGRYASVGGGLLLLALMIWFGKNLFADPQLSESSKLSESSMPPDTTKPAVSDNFPKQDTAKPVPLITPPSKSLKLSESSTKPENPAFSDPFEGQMIRVAGGTFTMGSPTTEQGRSNDECQYQVALGTFFMSKYEVTEAQWNAVMGNNPADLEDCTNCPVKSVSWNEVQTFIDKLNSLSGKKYRLPTEAEWEYAARGGQKSTGYNVYAGGNSLGSLGWFEDNSGKKPHPVGGKSPNELGLYDMSGNVWEWCQDTYKPYPCGFDSRKEGVARVMRGGSWSFSPQYCRSAHRNSYGLAYRFYSVGFRLALQFGG